MTIGLRIKQRRKELRMSADTLAQRLGKDRSTIYRYEKGDIENLPIDILEPIARELSTTPAYLMGWKQEPEELADITAQILTDPHALSMFEDYLSLSESDRYAARLMISSLANKQKKTDAGGVSQEVEKVSLSETE